MSDELTFEEITRIALGGVDLNNVQISLLYTIIDLLLKKLNCENEKVTLTGIAAEKLDELLNASCCGPPLAFRDDGIKMPIKTFDNLDELENKVLKLENGLDQHLLHMKNVKLFYNETSSTASSNGSNVMPCTLYCDIEEPKNELVGALLRNKWFYNQLNKFLTTPLLSRFRVVELKAEKLQGEIENFKKDCTAALARIDVMEEIFINLLALREMIKENFDEYFSTMEEIQEVMDLKVNNADTPPLKRSLQSLIKRMDFEVNILKHLQTKPRALLCIAKTEETGKLSESIIRRFKKSQQFRTIPCGCDEASLHAHLVDRLDHIDINAVKRRSTLEFDKLEKFKNTI